MGFKIIGQEVYISSNTVKDVINVTLRWLGPTRNTPGPPIDHALSLNRLRAHILANFDDFLYFLGFKIIDKVVDISSYIVKHVVNVTLRWLEPTMNTPGPLINPGLSQNRKSLYLSALDSA